MYRALYGQRRKSQFPSVLIESKKKVRDYKKIRSKSWVVKWIVNTIWMLFIYGSNGDSNNRTIVFYGDEMSRNFRRGLIFFFYVDTLKRPSPSLFIFGSLFLFQAREPREVWALWLLYELCVFSIHEKWMCQRIREHITRASIHKLATLFFPFTPTPLELAQHARCVRWGEKLNSTQKKSIVDLIQHEKISSPFLVLAGLRMQMWELVTKPGNGVETRDSEDLISNND